jgi:hypothetical protein
VIITQQLSPAPARVYCVYDPFRAKTQSAQFNNQKIKIDIPVESGRIGAVDIVPPVAGELLLIEQSAVGAQESSTLVTFAPIMANVVGLKSHNRCQNYAQIQHTRDESVKNGETAIRKKERLRQKSM